MSQKEQLAPGISLIKPSYQEEYSRAKPTPRQQLVIGKLVANGRKPTSMAAVLVEAGYSPNTARAPTKVTESRGFQELIDLVMPDDGLSQLHKSLLKSMKLDHMVFPLGPKGEEDENFSGSTPNAANQIEKAGIPVERTSLTDKEITQLLADVGGTVRRIVHGDTARHVYFWAPNNKERLDALKLAYDLKGYTGKRAGPGDEPPANTTYNTYIQNNTINPNEPTSKQVVDQTLESMMAATQRKAIG
jgi:hypothetical protein